MASFNISEAQLVALFLESVFWGIFIVLYISCSRVLLFGDTSLKMSSAINWPMFVFVSVLFAISTLDVALGLFHNIRAFVQFTGRGGSETEFAMLSEWVNVLKLVDTVLQSILGDAMLIYRCWIIYGRSWRVVSPSILLWIGTTGSSSAALYYEGSLHSQSTINEGKLQPLITSFLACSIVLNILTTGLIVGRIWRVDKTSRQMNALQWSNYSQGSHKMTQSPRSRLREVMFTVIESGALYTGTAIITFITYLAHSNSSYGTSDVEVQIAGIAFTLIIIRSSSYSSERIAGSNQNVPLSVIDRSRLQITVIQDTEVVSDGIDKHVSLSV